MCIRDSRSVVARRVDHIQHMGFLRDLVQVVADPVQLPHTVKLFGRGRVLRDDPIDKMAQIRLAGNPACFDLLI